MTLAAALPLNTAPYTTESDTLKDCLVPKALIYSLVTRSRKA
jgi:hypothetical protein